jgi:hypothetical protein
MRRVSFLLAVAVLIVAFAVGCGGSSGSGASGEDVAAITRTYNTYIEAVKSGDGRTACDQLTPAYQRQASKLVAPTLQAKLKGATCPKAISEGTLPQLQRFTPHLERIQVNGDRASGFNPAEGPLGPQKVLFQRLGREWRISNSIFAR